eukprot:7019398-Prymnesium_polylepis.1
MRSSAHSTRWPPRCASCRHGLHCCPDADRRTEHSAAKRAGPPRRVMPIVLSGAIVDVVVCAGAAACRARDQAARGLHLHARDQQAATPALSRRHAIGRHRLARRAALGARAIRRALARRAGWTSVDRPGLSGPRRGGHAPVAPLAAKLQRENESEYVLSGVWRSQARALGGCAPLAAARFT